MRDGFRLDGALYDGAPLGLAGQSPSTLAEPLNRGALNGISERLQNGHGMITEFQ